jgi:hypothetical protein
MKPRRRRHVIDPADAARGQAAEQTFRIWLDASQVAHVYLDQTPMSVPDPLRGRLKRPDYLVGIPGVGLVAFDVKAKTIYPEGIIFDVAEVRKLRTFARLFHLTVYFACFNTSDAQQFFWVRLDQLDDLPAVRRNGSLTLCLPLDQALPVALNAPFSTAFILAIAQ